MPERHSTTLDAQFMTDAFELVRPSRERLPQYAAALERGWSPNNLRDVSDEQLSAIRKDPEAFLRDLVSLDVPVILPDGRRVPRLPFHVFWLWDGEFCGAASLRFQRGTEDLPPHVTGHIGYAVVPWKRGRGYASRTLALLLPMARVEGLGRVTVTCDDDNAASEHVILKNGGKLVSRGAHPLVPGKTMLAFCIDTPLPPSRDKDPAALIGIDAIAHSIFSAEAQRRGQLRSMIIDEPVTVVAADGEWPRRFEAEMRRLHHSLPAGLAAEIEHIGSTAVSGLDGKPIIDMMIGITAPQRIAELVDRLEQLGYESLGEAGVPGRWALRRRRPAGPNYNVSVIARSGRRWTDNIAFRDFLRLHPDEARRYAEVKRRAVAAGANTLFAYSDAKRSALERIATLTGGRSQPSS